MRKEWLWIGAAAVLLSACATTDEQQAPPAVPYNGPVVEISGVEPHYEPYNPGTLQDYKVNGDSYRIVKNPQNFSQTGLASWYGEESSGNRTAIGETFDPYALSAAHPTLPIPSYVRVTNLANGRQLVVRVNDRGPYVKGRIIDLSKAAADRLNLSNNTRVKVDFINVAPDGTLSGPGTVGTTVAKQSYALPARPNLSSGAMGTPVQQDAPALNNNDVHAIDNSTLTSGEPPAAATGNGGLLATTPGGTQSANAAAPSSAPLAAAATATTAGAAATAAATAPSAGYVVQVGALSNAERAQAWQQQLSQQFGVPGSVSTNGTVHRVQLGPFSDRQQALVLQQRLAAEAKQQSFVTAAH
ncbi:endolytic peptidoglycan transglycosylase RlpA [Serratia rubidaea]|uniref:Endolytic peptidoglycan transglycosylase RlpA n=1 Tax=Serratia rubidaea TaxID=61652 RepID=A0A448S153_SERRU|nr:endolytic peptidoglycan transglycosylase RlpA [Serratia rubidaea]VEI61362.1 Rare lipoprotein A precursor [Serratia rubidaea]HDJ1438347.1 endolytic peptidoglycan transglycosylase RlpA [Serratia rubidaea]HDJ1447529.1 endolytic peptidoglycan transglycosylase RlpA [Serratia rubidaea]HDJ1460214.1 endolytic peptidoglycan transglycosylase RlpA [Serratia rubidaea]HDJ2770410.1 endolytic peptidoglycan transglycosylase RlpA [Serratia rubidaea]